MNQSNNERREDRVFDGWAQRFDERIYADSNPKGIIRLKILQRDLQQVVLDKSSSAMKILDVGAGLGHMSVWLASLGHNITALEPSREMLNIVQDKVSKLELTEYIELQEGKLQEYSKNNTRKFDLIIFHAVLEWLADPQEAVANLSKLLKDGGYLSIMFYNKHSATMRSLLVGDFKRVNSDRLHGDGIKRMAPISPLIPEQVQQWLKNNLFDIESKSGVRCFYDYMLPEVRKKASIESVLNSELKLSKEQAWISLARYQHFICRLKDSAPTAKDEISF